MFPWSAAKHLPASPGSCSVCHMVWDQWIKPLHGCEKHQSIWSGLSLPAFVVHLQVSHILRLTAVSVFTGFRFLMEFEKPHHTEPAADHLWEEGRPLKGAQRNIRGQSPVTCVTQMKLTLWCFNDDYFPLKTWAPKKWFCLLSPTWHSLWHQWASRLKGTSNQEWEEEGQLASIEGKGKKDWNSMWAIDHLKQSLACFSLCDRIGPLTFHVDGILINCH